MKTADVISDIFYRPDIGHLLVLIIPDSVLIITDRILIITDSILIEKKLKQPIGMLVYVPYNIRFSH